MSKAAYVLFLLLLVSSIIASASAQATPISVSFVAASLPMPIGQTTKVSVTVTDTSNSTVQLSFVGLRFEWSPPTTFFIGGNSDKGAVLAAGEQVTYPIPVSLPSNVTAGTHQMLAYVSYRWLRNGNWTGVLGLNVVSPVPFAYPQSQNTPPPTISSTEQAPPPPPQNSSTLEAVGVVVLVVAIGLYLERARIRRLLPKRPKTGTEPPATAEGEKAATGKAPEEAPQEVKEEEEV